MFEKLGYTDKALERISDRNYLVLRCGYRKFASIPLTITLYIMIRARQ